MTFITSQPIPDNKPRQIEYHSLRKEIRSLANKYLIVGVTGHRDLLEEDAEKLRKKINSKLDAFKPATGKKILLVSACAAGADQLVMDCAKDRSDIALGVLLCMNKEEYINDSFQEYSSSKDYFITLSEKTAHYIIEVCPTNTKLNKKQRQEHYEQLGAFIVEYCDHIIALWDGVDGGGMGGTSDIMYMALHGKSLNGKLIRRKRSLVIHQLVTPRKLNHFPLGRRFDIDQQYLPTKAIYTWVETKVQNPDTFSWTDRLFTQLKINTNWLLVGIPLFIALIVIDFITGYQPLQDSIVFGVLLGFYISAWMLYRKLKYAHAILLQFVYPLFLAFLVLTLGTIGFSDLTSLGDRFFGAANLITLNTSVFSSLIPGCKPGTFLEIARILGGFLAGYAFVLAFSLATGKENICRIKFWFFRRFGKNKFSVLIGNGIMAVNTALDIAQKGTRVVFLAENIDEKYLPLLQDKKIWLLSGNLTSRQSLNKTYFWEAHSVFIMSESDEENFRTSQEMDELVRDPDKPVRSDAQWYIHMQDARQRDLLQRITRSYLHTFNIHENTARRLLLRYPIDRFDKNNPHVQATVAQVVIIGFGTLGQAIALSALQVGHFTNHKRLSLKVYYTTSDANNVVEFREKHPELAFIENKASQKESTGLSTIQDYTFFHNDKPIIQFEQLPLAESELINPFFSLYNFVQPTNVLSLYVCLPTGLESSSLLSTILPRLQWQKLNKIELNPQQTDVQVFCFYNFPDRDEELFVEMKLNSLVPNIPVFCFGNFLNECALEAIQNEKIDDMAKQIALLFEVVYNTHPDTYKLPSVAQLEKGLPFQVGNQIYNAYIWLSKTQEMKYNSSTDERLKKVANDLWKSLPEIHRESNRQAANHAWVKKREGALDWFKTDNSGPADLPTLEEAIKLEDQYGPFSNNFAELEHRRWCAEKLINGWLPIPQEEVHLWDKPHNLKKELQAQKLHKDLVNFAEFLDQETDTEDVKKKKRESRNKDISQILGLPFFFSTYQ